MRVRVKICGVMRADDALLAARLGASAIGFVFWPKSPRFVSPERARLIVDALPPLVTAVGVFADQPAAYVRDVAETVHLGAIQLHGHEQLSDYTWLPLPLIRAVAVRGAERPEELDALPAEVTPLLDAHDPERLGGTGRAIDWAVAADVAGRRSIILSGGLRPENVGVALAHVRPWAVDASSGIEHAPGVKDASKLRAFFDAVEAWAAAERQLETYRESLS
jgi:phosphoribosylanthranilate isomerase